MVRLWTPPNEGNVPLCVAPSVCEGHVCNEGDYGLTAAIMADTHCKSFVRELDTSIRFFVITPEGFGCDHDLARGCFDAYGRVYARGPSSIPNRGLEQRQPAPAGSWTYRGWCPPKAAMQPAPVPTPTPPGPSPSPTPAPSASPTPLPPGGNLPVPPLGTLPPEWDKPPVRVTVGDAPHNSFRVNDTRWRYVFNTTPRSAPPLIWRNTDEQWPPAAHAQGKRGEGPLMWWAAYPGTKCDMNGWQQIGPGQDCAVELPSRACDKEEIAEDVAQGKDPARCARPNAFMGSDVVIRPGGTNGGPEGIRKLCAAPPGKPELANCRKWDLRYGGWTALE